VRAAPPQIAIPHYEKFIYLQRERSHTVENGEFGADNQVELVNEGPVNILLER
jgi:D-tyrosyl-tRNA(Tyr) deacylase